MKKDKTIENDDGDNIQEKQQYLTADQVAKIMAVKTSLLSNWRVKGGGPAYVKLGLGKKSLIRYPLHGRQGLIAYMESRTRTSSSDVISEKTAGKGLNMRYL